MVALSWFVGKSNQFDPNMPNHHNHIGECYRWLCYTLMANAWLRNGKSKRQIKRHEKPKSKNVTIMPLDVVSFG